MAFVVRPSRNPIVQAAFAGLRAAEREAKKQKKEPEPTLAPKKKTKKK